MGEKELVYKHVDEEECKLIGFEVWTDANRKRSRGYVVDFREKLLVNTEKYPRGGIWFRSGNRGKGYYAESVALKLQSAFKSELVKSITYHYKGKKYGLRHIS